MTRKDYKIIAKALREAVLSPGLDTQTLSVAIGWLELALKEDNSKFNADKFRTACGLNAFGRTLND